MATMRFVCYLLLGCAVKVASRTAEVSDFEASCPAGHATRCQAATPSAPRAGGSTGSQGVEPWPGATLLDQELEELRAMRGLYKERIALLKELFREVAEQNQSRLPAVAATSGGGDASRESQARALQEGLPLLSEVTSSKETRPAASIGDYLISKAVILQEEPVTIVKFLPLRNPRTSSPTPLGQVQMPSTLLVVAGQADGTLRLFTPSGELATTFASGHEAPLKHVAVSPLHDEYIIVSSDAYGVIRVHKVNVRQRRVSREERQARRASTADKISQHLGSQLNVTVLFNKQMRVPSEGANGTGGERPQVTALAMASQQGTKYFIAGDAKGTLSVFTRNGTLHAKLDTGTGSAIKSLYVHLSTVLFLSGGAWGFVDLEKMEARKMDCPRFSGSVTAAIVDSQQQARVVAADDAGDLWVFAVQNKKQCKIEHRFPRGSVRPPVDLASVRGFTLALDGRSGTEPVSLAALNMSHVGKKKEDPVRRATPAVVWRRIGSPVRSWAVHKRYQQGDLMAFLSDDGHEIEIFEVLMQVYVQPTADNFGNFKLPVFAVAIVLVLGYQYVKGKGAFDPGLSEA